MQGDKLVIGLDAGSYALDTRGIAGIVEMERLPFLPGKRGFVSGIISFRNEPVTVIDLRSALGDFTGAEKAAHKVVVLRDKNRFLGIDIGAANISFLWNEEIEGATNERGLYTSGRIYAGGGPVDIIDWQALFNETTRLLTAEDHV